MNSVISGNQIATYIMGAVTYVLTEVAALVPSWSAATQHVIQGTGTVVAAGVLVAGAIHHLADAKTDKAAATTILASTEDKLRAQVTDAGLKPVA